MSQRFSLRFNDCHGLPATPCNMDATWSALFASVRPLNWELGGRTFDAGDCPWVQLPCTLVVSDSSNKRAATWGAALLFSASDRRNEPCRHRASRGACIVLSAPAVIGTLTVPGWPKVQLRGHPPKPVTSHQRKGGNASMTDLRLAPKATMAAACPNTAEVFEGLLPDAYKSLAPNLFALRRGPVR